MALKNKTYFRSFFTHYRTVSARKPIRVKKRKYVSIRIKKLRKFLAYATLFLAAIFLVSIAGMYLYLTKNLPRLDGVKEYRPSTVTKVYSRDGMEVGEFATEKRYVVPISKMPKLLLQAFVSAEDDRFFEHRGLDFFSILRAFIINLMEGDVVQGGSTITQQVAKSLLSPERTFERKAKEAILAYRIEKNLSKSEILHLYLNQIYLGHGAYGVQAAAHNYFHKNLYELNLAEISMLAGLPRAPSKYSPATDPETARQRQSYVLNRMVAEGYINIVEATDAMNTELKIYPLEDINKTISPYFTEYIRMYLEENYGAEKLYEDGLTVFTTLNSDMQKAAQQALKKGLSDLDKRQGYRGPIKHLNEDEIETYLERLQSRLDEFPLKEGGVYEGVVTKINSKKKYAVVKLGKEAAGQIPLSDMRWARKPEPDVVYYKAVVKDPAEVFSVSDVIKVERAGGIDKKGILKLSLFQEPKVQGAILTIDPKNGFVKAMVGGFDFEKSRFNRAVQAQRQPGSAFKPIIYSAAIDKGYTPSSIIMDTPIVFRDSKGNFGWRPKNYDGKFYGATTLRTALTKSRNVVTIKIARDIGLDYLIAYAKRMGIHSPLARDLSLALGSSSVSLLEMTSAYSIFAAGGKRHEPVFVTKIVDRDGNVLEKYNATTGKYYKYNKQKETFRKKISREGSRFTEETEDLFPEEIKNLPDDCAISPQTAYIMSNLLQGVVQNGTGWRAKALERPVGGKTGTTNDFIDAWFIGFTPDLVTGVWTGFDQMEPLGKNETGSNAASPIFTDFMKETLKDEPAKEFDVPEGITFTKVDAWSGLRVPWGEKRNVIIEAFKRGTLPRRKPAPIPAVKDEDEETPEPEAPTDL